MSKKNTVERKKLESYLLTLRGEQDALKKQISDLNRQLTEKEKSIAATTASIKALTPPELEVTDHAVLRFLERHEEIDLTEIREKILRQIAPPPQGRFGVVHEVVKITEKTINTIPISLGDCINDYLPIPLDERWLLQLGFKVHPWGWVFVDEEGFGLRLTIQTYTYEISGEVGPEMKYVHQPQNLYNALTGRELTLTQ